MVYGLVEKKNFSPDSEDFITSTVFGLFLTLPDDILILILKKLNIFHHLTMVESCHKLLTYSFWPSWDASGTSNQNRVEPDVYLHLDSIDIIIEVKKGDLGGQWLGQWKNELKAFFNIQKHIPNSVILLTLGGNLKGPEDDYISLDDHTVPVIKLSWIRFRKVIDDVLSGYEDGNIRRINEEIDLAFDCFGIQPYAWLDRKNWITKFSIKSQLLTDFIQIKGDDNDI